MPKVVLASNNDKKIAELNHLLADQQWEVVAQGTLGIPEIAETGLTFIENALIKARHASRMANLPALADDSGIVVNALHGAPGIYSARFAGSDASDTDNNKKLLAALPDPTPAQRSAHYHCTLVWLRHSEDPDPVICQGHWHGHILTSPRGTGGFGYDPLFWVEQEQCTAAELTAERKGLLSHRGIATRQLATKLAALNISGNH